MNGRISLQATAVFDLPTDSVEMHMGAEVGREAWIRFAEGASAEEAAIKLAEEFLEVLLFEDHVAAASVIYGACVEILSKTRIQQPELFGSLA